LYKGQEAVLQGHTCSVQCVAITSDNKYIVSGSLDKTIRI
jgi:WD domain, G-beta repeat.